MGVCKMCKQKALPKDPYGGKLKALLRVLEEQLIYLDAGKAPILMQERCTPRR